MAKLIIAGLLFFAGTGWASAETCPSFYRFVDFGKQLKDGELYRGGPTFRAEGFDRAPILEMDRTECRSLREISVDGRGNPIPIVTSIHYDPDRIDVDVTRLRLHVVEDTTVEAEKNARTHRANLARADGVITRGSDYLCAGLEDDDPISCQVVSPYPGNIALMAYCDADECTLPVMAMNERIVVSAKWPRLESTREDPMEAGEQIVQKARAISELLETLS